MLNSDSHVYLYAKGWYKRDPDIMIDLKKIYGLRNEIDPEYMQVRDVLQCLLHLVWKHIDSDHLFIEFLSDINPQNTWKVNYRPKNKYDFNYAVAYKCLSVLAITQVDNIFGGLDKADSKVLPLSKD